MNAVRPLAALLLTAACSATPASPDAPSPAAAGASATLTSSDGVQGTIRFVPAAGAVDVVVELSGLSPGPHGFHIHETGDCSADDFTSAGGHFNPHATPHGAPTDAAHHAGDFGNVVAEDDGTVSTTLRMDVVLEPDAKGSVIGRAVIVHAGADDLRSQPSGAAGPRVACGVIAADA
ncbi:MAG: superoxide dismutase family protein [Nannocystaceae bacterium]|nr:superoxide dismutase family protein [bacterium]